MKQPPRYWMKGKRLINSDLNNPSHQFPHSTPNQDKHTRRTPRRLTQTPQSCH
ncbi:hypothetical protein J5X98_17585 [Leptothermofonsia sichuanensis E412]|uniref:hypothetical protein n=1 Tax=Leptothermofonsia sichuanensis TaxID=2917832 RepID=UPI001CA6EEFD|nr:hypothetical protein [Leptothermofonsia sichuanensis]QZZ19205.1 hypothetical protein J5X98_17585 [Leptothermofonsia sichuanensis E412]